MCNNTKLRRQITEESNGISSDKSIVPCALHIYCYDGKVVSALNSLKLFSPRNSSTI